MSLRVWCVMLSRYGYWHKGEYKIRIFNFTYQQKKIEKSLCTPIRCLNNCPSLNGTESALFDLAGLGRAFVVVVVVVVWFRHLHTNQSEAHWCEKSKRNGVQAPLLQAAEVMLLLFCHLPHYSPIVRKLPFANLSFFLPYPSLPSIIIEDYCKFCSKRSTNI